MPPNRCVQRLPADRGSIRIKRWRSRLPKHSDTMMTRCSPANFMGWVIRSGTLAVAGLQLHDRLNTIGQSLERVEKRGPCPRP
jgi:hypothetical protein